MFNGLKKMVGKSADDTPNINCPQSCTNSMQLNMSSNKFTKKRKVTERERLSSMKKKYENLSFTVISCKFWSFIVYTFLIFNIRNN